GFAFVACHGGGADPNHNGAKLAARVVCEDVAMATCDKAEACGAAQPPGGGNCFDTFMAACCTGAACDQQTPDTQQQVDACTNDIAHGSCADLANNFPKSCTSL
ncbi:MAG TPA: hypothetical protein VKE22_17140, partial [Haliangiales bacterium]|nr:hypothetical protein [Haliangiales bacterium]